MELIPASKKPIQQLYSLRQYWEAKSSFCQATTYPAKISLIRSGLLLTFKVEWSHYIYWAHGESRRGAWIKVLSPMGRGSGTVSLVHGEVFVIFSHIRWLRFLCRDGNGAGWGRRMGSSSLPRMVLSCPILARPHMTGKTFSPHPYPLGPPKSRPIL